MNEDNSKVAKHLVPKLLLLAVMQKVFRAMRHQVVKLLSESSGALQEYLLEPDQPKFGVVTA